ncbi:hypothetical protein PROFUN_08119, partial [Planoprotostelium fungivorum]
KDASPGIEPESAKARHSNKRLGFTTPPLERPDYTNPRKPEGSAFCKFWPENSRKPVSTNTLTQKKSHVTSVSFSTTHAHVGTYPTIYTTINGTTTPKTKPATTATQPTIVREEGVSELWLPCKYNCVFQFLLGADVSPPLSQ